MNKKTKCILALSTVLALTQPMNAVADEFSKNLCIQVEEFRKIGCPFRLANEIDALYDEYHMSELRDIYKSKDIERAVEYKKRKLAFVEKLAEKYRELVDEAIAGRGAASERYLFGATNGVAIMILRAEKEAEKKRKAEEAEEKQGKQTR